MYMYIGRCIVLQWCFVAPSVPQVYELCEQTRVVWGVVGSVCRFKEKEAMNIRLNT